MGSNTSLKGMQLRGTMRPLRNRKAQPGWALVTFDLTAEGTVIEARVSDSSPEGAFDKSVLKAINDTAFAPSDRPRKGCSKVFEFNIGRWDP